MAVGGRCAKLRQRLLAHALNFPEAWEDHPWDEVVAKVRKKVVNDPLAEPTGYGLGKSGWVSLNFAKAADVDPGFLEDLIDESYRAVAPKKLIAELDTARAV